jgi:hypothetical protein
MHVTFDEFVGIGEQAGQGLTLTLLPNPARDQVNVTINGLTGHEVQLTLSDITGKTVLSETLSSVGKEMKHRLNLNALSKGIYIVRIKTDDQVKTERLILN